eukprot:TRINITY_DN54988_c0_g1_i1.p1 TRINITY_DN54988_c0_g1~~TRINITY_DN54988_c0_g1_i1.p1  ORF type:complete len:380 (-),score=78.49 TRINITY_DN54988_c0_g1_i1:2-1111(-)
MFFQPRSQKSKDAASSSSTGAAPAVHATVQKNKPWVEKYRPQRIDDVVHQDEIISNLRNTLRQPSNLTHLLFHGPPGTGKTTTILAVCHELFGPEYFKSRVKELNASDDRGIDVVRSKIKKFAQSAVTHKPNQQQSDGKWYPVPSYKVIILDEADALLPDAQAALRRVLEDYADTTRFCLICNYVSRIIDPIASRCAKYRFKPLSPEPLHRRINYICEVEGLRISEPALHSLEHVSSGDLRLAITYLQGAQRLYGDDLTTVDFSDIAGHVPPQYVEELFNVICSNSFDAVQQSTKDLVAQGFSAAQLLSQLHDRLVQAPDDQLSGVAKARIMFRMSETAKHLADGADEYLQLLSFASFAMQVFSGLRTS